MDIEFIEKLITIVAKSPIEKLDLKRDGWRVRIVKSARPASEAPRGRAATPAATAVPATAVSPDPEHPVPVAQTQRHVVRAMLTGTFYRSATENGPPMVSVGDPVEEGQPLGILEAMKVLNPIESTVGGRIAEILAENAQPVESGSPLFAIETH